MTITANNLRLKHRSKEITEGPERAPARSYLWAMGLNQDDMDRPFVAIANLASDVTPCNVHLDRFAQAMLRIYALSNEITLRVAAKKEDLMELHGEFNARALAVLDNWDFTIDRYNEIERSSQLIPNIRKELSKRIRATDERLQSLARTPTTLEDARRLLEGRVNYPITAATMPWFASDSDLKDLVKDRMGGQGMNPMNSMLPGSKIPGM